MRERERDGERDGVEVGVVVLPQEGLGLGCWWGRWLSRFFFIKIFLYDSV